MNVDYSREALAVVSYPKPDPDPFLSELMIQQCCGSGSTRILDFLAVGCGSGIIVPDPDSGPLFFDKKICIILQFSCK
jgi:hypothetical protein